MDVLGYLIPVGLSVASVLQASGTIDQCIAVSVAAAAADARVRSTRNVCT